jgi:formate/nitrite transporter FocA (FNT family)
MLLNWTIVWFGNLFGALGLVVMVYFSHRLDMNDGRVGLWVLTTAVERFVRTCRQRHPMQRARLRGSLACLCGPIRH